jgi:hypothetical protein
MKKLPKNEVLEKIEQEHQRLLATLNEMDGDEMLTAGVIPTPDPGQNAKDILAHLSAWEQRMQRQIRSILRNTTLPLYPNTSEFNRQVYETNKDRVLEDVLAGFEHSYQVSLSEIQQLSEAELTTDGVWQMIGFNTYNHYAWAYKEIQQWKQNRAIG